MSLTSLGILRFFQGLNGTTIGSWVVLIPTLALASLAGADDAPNTDDAVDAGSPEHQAPPQLYNHET